MASRHSWCPESPARRHRLPADTPHRREPRFDLRLGDPDLLLPSCCSLRGAQSSWSARTTVRPYARRQGGQILLSRRLRIASGGRKPRENDGSVERGGVKELAPGGGGLSRPSGAWATAFRRSIRRSRRRPNRPSLRSARLAPMMTSCGYQGWRIRAHQFVPRPHYGPPHEKAQDEADDVYDLQCTTYCKQKPHVHTPRRPHQVEHVDHAPDPQPHQQCTDRPCCACQAVHVVLLAAHCMPYSIENSEAPHRLRVRRRPGQEWLTTLLNRVFH
jgi:hypothetical protein